MTDTREQTDTRVEDERWTDPTRPVYVISVAAELVRVHPRTLRIYELEGLICPARTRSNIRLYSENDIRRVLWIRHLTRNLGVNLAGVRVLFELEERLGMRILETLYEDNITGDQGAPEPGDRSRRGEGRRRRAADRGQDPRSEMTDTIKTDEQVERDRAGVADAESRELPLVPLRETVIFPEMIVPLQVGRDKSVQALNKAVADSSPIVLVTQRQADLEDVTTPSELYAVGTLAKIAQVVQLQDGTVRAIVQGQQRVRLLEFVSRTVHPGPHRDGRGAACFRPRGPGAGAHRPGPDRAVRPVGRARSA